MKKRILIIEDDKHMLDLIALIVHDLDHEATACHSVETALIDFKQTNYDLVIIDLFMEGIGGIEGIKKISELSPEVPIIAMSAGYAKMPPDIALKAAAKIGAHNILTKPFKIERLTELIELYLQDGKPVD